VSLLLAVLALAFAWGWKESSESRALARMNAADRTRLFGATRDEANALCSDPDLEERCRTQVELLSLFPECDTECQAFVARHRPRSVR
jgi:hypothetical protein